MANWTIKRLESLAELRSYAGPWDDLWERSDAPYATSRAELVAQWCEHFTPHQPFAAIVLEDESGPQAALPVIAERRFGIRRLSLPGSSWSPAGDVLIARDADPLEACRELLRGLAQLNHPLLFVGEVPWQAPRWQSFGAALAETGHDQLTRPRYAVTVVEMNGTWDSYLASRSRNHRRSLRVMRKRADEAGGVRLENFEELSPRDVAGLLRPCFEVEAAGWKGQHGSAVLCVPGMSEFYVRQAEQLAAWQQLSLTRLMQDDRVLAFEYGWRAKGQLSVLKVAYDETCGRLSPGQLLRAMWFENNFARDQTRVMDFVGPTTNATTVWATAEYQASNTLVALSDYVGSAVVAAYRHGSPLVRRLRASLRGTDAEGLIRSRRDAAAEANANNVDERCDAAAT